MHSPPAAFLSRALYPNQPNSVTIASLLATPFRPFAVSAMHTMVRAPGTTLALLCGGPPLLHSGWPCSVLLRKEDVLFATATHQPPPTNQPTNQPQLPINQPTNQPTRPDPTHQAMEVSFLQRALNDPALRTQQRLHSAAALAGIALFVAEDSVPHVPFVHCSWHLCSAAATNAIHALLDDVERTANGGGLVGKPQGAQCAALGRAGIVHDSAASLLAGGVGGGAGGAKAERLVPALVVSPLQLTA
jgi:hypothetical protein